MKIAVLSLRFAPGHVAHLRAYREMFSELGCEVRLFLDKPYKEFMDDDVRNAFINSVDEVFAWSPERVISYNIANENIRAAKMCKKKDIPFFYILHEPWDSFKELLALGKRAPRRIAANIVNYLTSINAHKVILASSNGAWKYTKYMKACNKNFEIFPLIFFMQQFLRIRNIHAPKAEVLRRDAMLCHAASTHSETASSVWIL